MSEPTSEGTTGPTTGSATLPSYQPTTAGAARARQTADPALAPEPALAPASTSTGSPAYVPRTLQPAREKSEPARAAETSTGDTAADSVEFGSAGSAAAPAPVPARAITPTPAPRVRTSASAPRVRRTRKARLRIARVDPWSVMKTALLFGIAGGIIFVVATYVVMSVIESTGVYQAINTLVGSMLTSPTDTTPFSIETYINTRRVTGLAALIGAVDVVIFTALATVFSFLYNLSATMLGGLEITLAED